MKTIIRPATYVFAVLCIGLIWASCSKNKSVNPVVPPPTDTTVTPPPPPPPPAVTPTTLITYLAWKYDTAGLDLNKDGVIDQALGAPILLDCQRDDSYAFKKDSTGIVNAGANLCNVGDPQTVPFTWSFNTAQTTLVSTFNPVLQAGVTIIKLDSTQLSVYRDTTVFGNNFRVIVKLKH